MVFAKYNLSGSFGWYLVAKVINLANERLGFHDQWLGYLIQNTPAG